VCDECATGDRTDVLDSEPSISSISEVQMAKSVDIAKVTSGVYTLVKDLDPGERLRAMNAVLTMLGEAGTLSAGQGGAGSGATGAQGGPAGTGGRATGGARAYFDTKDPKSKIEELAVAARYREENVQADTHTKEDLEAVVRTEARRNFDRNNFNRDVSNAKVAGLFNKGSDLALSYYGQQYVDTLPDREALARLRRPKGGKAKKGKAKGPKPR
jgi:hypothetical protein